MCIHSVTSDAFSALLFPTKSRQMHIQQIWYSKMNDTHRYTFSESLHLPTWVRKFSKPSFGL